MSLLIRVESEHSAEALQDLLDTLLDDDVLRMRARPQPAYAEPEPGRLSLGLIAAIEIFIAVNDAADLSSRVARAVKRWRAGHEKTASIRVSVEYGGKTVELPAGEIDAAHTVQLILGLLPGSAAPVTEKPADVDHTAS
jgi:hypothetical protein